MLEARLAGTSQDTVVISGTSSLDALHRVLNAIVHEVGPAMELYNAVDMARRAA